MNFKIIIYGHEGVGTSTFLKKYAKTPIHVDDEIEEMRSPFSDTIYYNIRKEFDEKYTVSSIMNEIKNIYDNTLHKYSNKIINAELFLNPEIQKAFGFKVKISPDIDWLSFIFDYKDSKIVCRGSIKTEIAKDFFKVHGMALELINFFKNFNYSVELIDQTETSSFSTKSDRELIVGADFFLKKIMVDENTINLQIWHITSEERFQFLIPTYIKGALGAILIFDITNSKTLYHLIEVIRIINENVGNIPIILVGNKVDLKESREVFKEEGNLFKESYSLASYIEISSKLGYNIETVFIELVKLLLKYAPQNDGLSIPNV
ncbi:MAG: Rab family GTPase [Candidatus Odinarchaeota archaeon]